MTTASDTNSAPANGFDGLQLSLYIVFVAAMVICRLYALIPDVQFYIPWHGSDIAAILSEVSCAETRSLLLIRVVVGSGFAVGMLIGREADNAAGLLRCDNQAASNHRWNGSSRIFYTPTRDVTINLEVNLGIVAENGYTMNRHGISSILVQTTDRPKKRR